MKNLDGVGICQIETPRSEVFVDQPRNSVDMLLLLARKFKVDDFLATLGVGIVSRYRSSLLATSFLYYISHGVPTCRSLIQRVKHSLTKCR